MSEQHHGHDDHDGHDDHVHDDGVVHRPIPPSPIERRVAALEEMLVEQGYLTSAEIDSFVQLYEHDIGPMNGARVVARAWSDDAYRERLLADGTAAIAELGFGGPEGDLVIVLENTAELHNVVVCTLCSCYPWPVLGLPPEWYKSAPYRSRVVREPRTVLAEMGYEVGDEMEVRVWDSSAEARYLVLPRRPADTDDLTEEELAALVTRDGMVGVAER
ncbi:MAG: nitrile hydratase subunit alpha [Acidimicrobiales bacterium]